MNAAPSVGVERAFKRELGLSLEDLGDEWKEDMQQRHLPQIGNLDRARKFATPLLTQRRSGGEIFLAPSLSSDGKNIVFLSNGSFMRGEVFIDLWLGDAETGKRITRLVKSTFDPNFEELRLLYSQSAFSPDGRQLAFTAQREGRDVLYLLDVKSHKELKRFDLPLEAVTGPSWSPDGKRIVFSGSNGGLTDLYIVDIETSHLERLTNDRYGDLQPQWSPDGKVIAFASDRGDTSSFTYLRFPKWRITLLDLEKGTITVLPNQGGLNINPQWSPDGRSIAYVSDRTGIANVFLYDFDSAERTSSDRFRRLRSTVRQSVGRERPTVSPSPITRTPSTRSGRWRIRVASRSCPSATSRRKGIRRSLPRMRRMTLERFHR